MGPLGKQDTKFFKRLSSEKLFGSSEGWQAARLVLSWWLDFRPNQDTCHRRKAPINSHQQQLFSPRSHNEATTSLAHKK